MFSLEDVCSAFLAILEQKQSKTMFDLWFKDLKMVSLTENSAVFSINSDIKRSFLETKWTDLVASTLVEVVGFKPEVTFTSSESEFTIPEEILSTHEKKESITSLLSENEKKEEKIDFGTAIENHSIVADYTFDNFIVGESNKFAHAACYAVATSSDTSYNPLLIHGPSGLGKTHLLYAITNEIKRNNPDVRIVYKRSEDFTNELISHIRTDSMPAFRSKYRNADVLLIDDIQFIAGKESTQEEFFHTFNELNENNKQIILTSDRPPNEIRTLEERIRTRLEWGLIADIQPPSFELRTAIIQKKAEALHISIPAEIVNYLAEKLQNNIRQIEGAIKKIAAISMLTGNPVTEQMCKNAISNLVSGKEPPSVTVDKILKVVSQTYEVSVEDMKSKKRQGEIANARHVAIYLIRQLTDLSLNNVADIFNRDHTTVMSSDRKVKNDIDSSKAAEAEIDELIRKIKNFSTF
ncbi:MAG: chromosomal replication initiator protein DnaA [Clostridia bacterium]|nr:chromosomal replication initiator protein DnaA [Clostridia bacterium]